MNMISTTIESMYPEVEKDLWVLTFGNKFRDGGKLSYWSPSVNCNLQTTDTTR